MQLTKCFLLALLAFIGTVACSKLKFVAFKGPHGGFVGLKVRKPKLLGHHGLGGFGGFGGGIGGHSGFGSGGYHSSGYEHHESHQSYSSSSGGFGGGFGGFGSKLGWLGK